MGEQVFCFAEREEDKIIEGSGIVISMDSKRISLDEVEALLRNSYWAAARSREDIKASIENSLCFGIYEGDRQIGFARVITDYCSFAYLCDVIINEEYRGQGLGKALLDYIFGCKQLQRIKSWNLKTKDAHSLYEKYGFVRPEHPEIYMHWFKK